MGSAHAERFTATLALGWLVTRTLVVELPAPGPLEIVLHGAGGVGEDLAIGQVLLTPAANGAPAFELSFDQGAFEGKLLSMGPGGPLSIFYAELTPSIA